MKSFWVAFIVFLSSCLVVQAQEREKFDAAGRLIKEFLDIQWSLPAGYGVVQLKDSVFAVNMLDKPERAYAGFLYLATVVSKDGESKLLYAISDGLFNRNKTVSGRFQQLYTDELYSSINKGLPFQKEPKLDPSWQRFITELSKDEARRAYNADSVCIIDFPSINHSKEGYTHCIGVYLMENAHSVEQLKLLLTEKGYADKNRRLKQIEGCIRFGDSSYQYDWKRANKFFDKFTKIKKRRNLIHTE